MDRPPNRARSSYETHPEDTKVYERRQAKTVVEAEISPRIFKDPSDNAQTMGKVEKSLEEEKFYDAVILDLTTRAMLLATSIFILCYYGLMEYSVLENGQILQGSYSRRAIMTFSLGYSLLHSIISAIAAGMLVYSIILKQSQFSLPLIGLFLTEIVSDFCDAIVMIWYLFKYLQLETVLFYVAVLLLLIMTELWTWLGVLRLYERRNFKSRQMTMAK